MPTIELTSGTATRTIWRYDAVNIRLEAAAYLRRARRRRFQIHTIIRHRQWVIEEAWPIRITIE